MEDREVKRQALLALSVENLAGRAVCGMLLPSGTTWKGIGVINRYTRPAMGAIWELQNKFEIWKEIEVLACEAQAELGKSGITKEEAAWIREHADFTVERIDEIEKVTNHDVIAFTTNMAEYIDADVPEGTEPPSRWVHYGMTSSDLGDTALSYQITQAMDIILRTWLSWVRPASAARSSSRRPCASAARTASTPSP